VVTKLTIFAESKDKMVGVHFDTEVRHRKNDSAQEILGRASKKLKNYLARYNPSVGRQVCTRTSTHIIEAYL
jgi:hypothetical protein